MAEKLTQKQRDGLLMARSEEERERIRKGIEKYGRDYEPATHNSEDWWPNKYPDM